MHKLQNEQHYGINIKMSKIWTEIISLRTTKFDYYNGHYCVYPI